MLSVESAEIFHTYQIDKNKKSDNPKYWRECKSMETFNSTGGIVNVFGQLKTNLVLPGKVEHEHTL